MSSYLSVKDFFVYSCDIYSLLACQSVGAAGLAAGTQAGIFGAATGIGGLAAGLFGKKKKNEDETDDTSSNNDTPHEASNEKMDQEKDFSENDQSKFNYSFYLNHFNFPFKIHYKID
jgi:hypothetical protein